MSEPTRARGKLIVLAAPSGAGKTSLVHALLRRTPELKFSISYTTRPPRDTEVDGEDYLFVSHEEFMKMIDSSAFLEYAQVFDHWYGTGRQQVDALLTDGYSVLLEIDWQGARQVREALPEACSVFILPPSLPELERRLRGRATDSEATIVRRLRDAASDMTHWSEFDYALINDDLDDAADRLAGIVGGRDESNRTRSKRLRGKVESILANRGEIEVN